MISPPDHQRAAAADVIEPQKRPNMNWRKAITELIASRIAMLQLEGQEALAQLASRAILFLAFCGCGLAAWALALAGGISWIAEASGWHWSRVCLSTALVHLIAAIILGRKAIRPLSATFTATLNEFKKDREWIENFHSSKKSND
jgi:uncharacterized membrane protein YqjE